MSGRANDGCASRVTRPRRVNTAHRPAGTRPQQKQQHPQFRVREPADASRSIVERRALAQAAAVDQRVARSGNVGHHQNLSARAHSPCRRPGAVPRTRAPRSDRHGDRLPLPSRTLARAAPPRRCPARAGAPESVRQPAQGVAEKHREVRLQRKLESCSAKPTWIHRALEKPAVTSAAERTRLPARAPQVSVGFSLQRCAARASGCATRYLRDRMILVPAG